MVAVLLASVGLAQKKIIVLGSSTAYGYGASVPDSAWVARLQASFRKNTADGVDTVIDNRAMPGFVTYKGMPSDYTMPANRTNPAWAPDPLRNVTWVLSQNPRPDVVLLSYPSNDANLTPDYQEKETMDNLRLMFSDLSAAGIHCYVTSTQPRNDMTDLQRTELRELRDSIVATFGLYSIVFWDDLATTDGLNMLRPEVNSGDGIHPNDYGHRLLFQKVQAKNIFRGISDAALPLSLRDWQAVPGNNAIRLQWRTLHEVPGTSFDIQRKSGSGSFQSLWTVNATGQDALYSWTDPSPFGGTSQYRLKITEPGVTLYSSILTVVNEKNRQLTTSLYADGALLHIQINSNREQPATLSIITMSGALAGQQFFALSRGMNSLSMPVSRLASGSYILKVTLPDGSLSTGAFAIRK